MAHKLHNNTIKHKTNHAARKKVPTRKQQPILCHSLHNTDRHQLDWYQPHGWELDSCSCPCLRVHLECLHTNPGAIWTSKIMFVGSYHRSEKKHKHINNDLTLWEKLGQSKIGYNICSRKPGDFLDKHGPNKEDAFSHILHGLNWCLWWRVNVCMWVIGMHNWMKQCLQVTKMSEISNTK